MKTKLNILCLVTFLAMLFSLYKAGLEFGTGFKMGTEFTNQNLKEIKKLADDGKNPFFLLIADYNEVLLLPTEAMFKPDTLLNKVNNTPTPVLYSSLLVKQKVTNNQNSAIQMICSFLTVASLVVALIFFINFIIEINRFNIFEWKNVKRLRVIGFSLLAAFILSAVPILINYYSTEKLFSIEGYVRNSIIPINISDLFLALACLIAAETFAIGLRLKEEQELTI